MIFSRHSISLIIVFLLFFALTVHAQEYWTPTNGPEGGEVKTIEVDQSNGNVWAGAGPGKIFLSTNNGTSWDMKNSPITSIYDILIDGSTVYMVTTTGLFVSDDDGTTWSENTSAPGGNLYDLLKVNDDFYLSTYSSGIHKSTDGGDTWNAINNGLTTNTISCLAYLNGRLFAGSYYDSLFISDNSGSSWEGSNNGLEHQRINDLMVVGNDIYCLNYSKLYKSSNSGNTWSWIDFGSDIYAFTKSGSIIYVGGYDGSVWRSTDNGNTWTSSNIGSSAPVMSLAVSEDRIIAGTSAGFHTSPDFTDWDPSNQGFTAQSIQGFNMSGNTIYTTSYYMGITQSTDRGAMWTPINNGLPYNYSWTGIAVDGSNLYTTASSGYVYKSINAGILWSQLHHISDQPTFTTGNGDTIIVGTYRGEVHISLNKGAGWSQIDNGQLLDQPPTNIIRRIEFNGSKIFVESDDGFYRTTNLGSNWEKLTTLSINDFDETKGVLYATSSNSVFRSIDDGDTWENVSGNLPASTSYAISAENNRIIIAQYNDGNPEPIFLSENGGQSWSEFGVVDLRVRELYQRNTTFLAGGYGGPIYISHDVQRSLDSLALVALYNNTNGANWINNSNWLSGQDVSTWYGVTFEHGRVTGIDLNLNSLYGTIPADITNLTSLTGLYLRGNQISGSIPLEIGNLGSLELLDISYNQFTDSIPPEIGNLSLLRELSLNSNNLNGSIPNIFGSLDSLRILNLARNDFKDAIPSELWNLTKLEHLDFSYNQLSGSLPSEIGNLTNLIHLDLGANMFSGNIPTEIGNLTNLEFLNLWLNSLSGSIPTSIGNLLNLQGFIAHFNQLSGPLPVVIGNLTQLAGLRLGYNSLSGEIPDIWSNLDNLTVLAIEHNQMTGPIPPSVGAMDDLRSLLLNHNMLEGAVPTTLANASQLEYLRIQVNQLTDLPNLSGISTWQQLLADSNNFTFEDFEPNIGINGLVYAPQYDVGVEIDTVVNSGDNITLAVDVGGANNNYEWFFNDGSMGVTAPSISINDASAENAGTYHCVITNTIVTDLILNSRPIHLIVAGSPPAIINVNSASNISATAADLSATINPSGLATNVTFEYGLSTGYGQSEAADQNPLNGLTNQVASATIVNLLPGETYHFRVTATNDSGEVNSADQTFNTPADNVFPTVSDVILPNDILLGQPVTISCSVSDNTGLRFVYLKHRQGGDALFDSTEMTLTSGTTYQGTIPGLEISVRGIEYYIRATDVAGNRTDSWHFTLPVIIPSNTLSVTIPAAPASDDPNQLQRGYRMISVPAAIDNRSMSAVLDDDLNGEHIKDWRVYKWIGGEYQEYTKQGDIALFEPGSAFWIISRRSITVDYPEGVTIQTTDDYNIEYAGNNWHQIGIPCNYSVSWQDVLDLSGPDNFSNSAWSYEGGSSYVPATVLEPFKGYFVKNIDTSTQSLVFPLHGNNASLQKHAPEGNGWQASIRVNAQNIEDNWNIIGVRPSANHEWDYYDSPEPPPIGHFVSLYFPHPDWQEHPDRYTFDFRDENDQGYVWDMVLQSNVPNENIELDFQDIQDCYNEGKIDNTFTAILIDPDLKISQDIIVKSHYKYPSGSKPVTKSLRLIVGTNSFIEENNLGIQSVPLSFNLMQNYPNPFNPSTTIYFSIATQSSVTLTIFNILGERVTTLLDQESFESGYHFVQWDGNDRSGIRVASGIYLYQLRSEGTILTKKMILIR